MGYQSHHGGPDMGLQENKPMIQAAALAGYSGKFSNSAGDRWFFSHFS